MYTNTGCNILNRLKKNKEYILIYFGPTDNAMYNDIYLPMLEEYTNDRSGFK